MYTFEFKYKDKSNKIFEHIKSVKYNSYEDGEITVSEQDILTYLFPLNCNMYLFSDDSTNTATHKDLTSISAFKES